MAAEEQVERRPALEGPLRAPCNWAGYDVRRYVRSDYGARSRLETPSASAAAAICRRADLVLITLDRRLAAAAEALGVSSRLLAP